MKSTTGGRSQQMGDMPRAVGAPSLEVLKARSDGALGSPKPFCDSMISSQGFGAGCAQMVKTSISGEEGGGGGGREEWVRKGEADPVPTPRAQSLEALQPQGDGRGGQHHLVPKSQNRSH